MNKLSKMLLTTLVVSGAAIGSAGCSSSSGSTSIDSLEVTWNGDTPSITVPSGFTTTTLQVKVLEAGDGTEVKESDSIEANYVGVFTDGTIFDSSYERGAPSTFPLGGVIQGWREGLSGLKTGTKVLLAIPPDLGYGSEDYNTIPGNSVLIFVVEIIKIA
jgi:peptidylprolyl isomerase